MDTLTTNWVEATKNAIISLQKNYQENRGMLLTEGDLECHLFSELLKQPCLSGYHYPKDDSFWKDGKQAKNLKTTFVHSQVTWFKDKRQSGYEVDLTICDPKNLEVVNIELFEEYPHKGYAHDGPCVAIELKFIRDGRYPKQYDEDYFSLRDDLIPDKLANILNGKYEQSNKDNIAFLTIVGCKKKEQFDKAKEFLGKHLSDETKPCPENLFVCIFYQDEIIWDKEVLKQAYKAKAEELKDNS
jgi:hypothetical protein